MSELLPVETELWERDMNFAYDKGKVDGAREFAEVIKSQSSEMVQAFIDRQLAEWQKEVDNG